jgi:CheY-like chemotaxis protein
MRDYATQLLSSRWEVEAVANGQTALEAARRRKPDLVLADVMMPN